MALTKCGDCGKDVSDSAPTCPGCGRPIAKPKPKPTSGCAWGCLLALIGGFFMMGQCGSAIIDTATRTPTPAARPAAARPAAATAQVSNCQRHIELFGSEFWAKELGQSEMWVLANHQINLWQNPSPNKGRVVGKMRVGSRSVILQEGKDDYRVQSPLDRSAGWVGKTQVARTLYQDTKTFKPCSK